LLSSQLKCLFDPTTIGISHPAERFNRIDGYMVIDGIGYGQTRGRVHSFPHDGLTNVDDLVVWAAGGRAGGCRGEVGYYRISGLNI